MKFIQFWQKLFGRRDLGINTPGWTEYFAFGGGARTIPGVYVNEEKAMQVAAVYACVSYIADYVASLPKITYERLQKGRNRATNHYLYPIVHDQPNPYMNDYEFTECLTGHVLLWGNAYAEIVRNGGGEVAELWPLRPDRVRPFIDRQQLWYEISLPDGGQVVMSARNIFHLRGPGFDGLCGQSPIKLHKETIALAFAEQEYRSRFFGNNASPGGALQTDKTMSEPAQQRLRKQWEELHAGLQNAHRVAIFEEGLKWEAIGIPAKDMEFIEGRKYQKAEIATIFRVKPSKIGIFEPGTVSFASIEQQAIDTHFDTMMPWVSRWERKFNSLMTESERRRYYVEFLFDAVLRADSGSRARTLQIWRQNGLISANQWLELENRNPISEDDGGDDFWRPGNMLVAGAPPVVGPMPAAWYSSRPIIVQDDDTYMQDLAPRNGRAVRN